MIYLDGNSLGPTPKAAFAEIETAVRQEWAEGLIRRWNAEDWFDLPQLYGDLLAPLIGPETAAMLVNHVDYRTGAVRDMASLTRAAHDAGAVVIWDLCHSAGAMPVALNSCGADMAVGCTYKYLSGGPGAPAFLFCAGRNLPEIRQPLSGWWGHAAPFGCETWFRPEAGIRRFLCGTQPILSLRALNPVLHIFEAVDMVALRAKSMALTGLFIELVEQSCAPFGLELASPREATRRGNQVAFACAGDGAGGYPVMQALIAAGVIGDFRAPDILRFGFAETCRAAEALHRILATGVWQAPEFQARQKVT